MEIKTVCVLRANLLMGPISSLGVLVVILYIIIILNLIYSNPIQRVYCIDTSLASLLYFNWSNINHRSTPVEIRPIIIRNCQIFIHSLFRLIGNCDRHTNVLDDRIV